MLWTDVSNFAQPGTNIFPDAATGVVVTMDHKTRNKWRLVGILTLIGAAFGLAYTLLRVAGGVMVLSLAELEHATRTGTFVGFCLGLFMVFYIYDQRGAAIRRLSFLAGWIVIDGASTVIIAFAILIQRGVAALVYGEPYFFVAYLTNGFWLDVLVAFLVFVVIALFMQIRPLLGPGTMWKVMTGRYHHPRKERRIYMFLDIKNSTAMAERLGDERTHALISEVFFDADRRIAEHGGEVLRSAPTGCFGVTKPQSRAYGCETMVPTSAVAIKAKGLGRTALHALFNLDE
jgi:adenylate cyclase